MGFLKQVSGGAIDLEGVFSPEVSQIATLGALYLTGGALAGAIGASATSGLSIALADTAISGATIVTAGYAIGTVASVFVMSEAMKAITGQGAAGGAANVNQNLATGILLNTASNVAGIPVIYGTRRVGGTRIFTEVSGASNEYLHLLIVLGEGEISAVPQVYIDNVPITDAKFAGLVSSTLYTGTDTQAAYGTLIAALPTKWTAAHQGKGVAYLALQLKYATTAFSGFPAITADVQGKKVYDPRSGLTAYSNNPALCIRDYLTNTRYGRGIAAALIDDGTIISAANYCDALVTVPGGSQARYTCDGVVDINQTAYDNIKALLTSCRGLLVYSGGLYKLMLDQPTAATFAFTEDNITGNWTITQPGRRSKYNRVTAGFFNPAASWNPDLAISDSSAYRLIDNSLLLEAKIDLPFCADLYRAQQLAGLHLKQSRFGVTCMFTAFQSGLRCEVGDVVSITHSTPGWSGKLFRVMQITIKDTDEVEVVVNEYDATVYNLDTLTAVTSTTTLTLPNVFAVPTPTGLSLSSGTSELLLNGDGTVTSRLKVAWTAPTNIFADKIEIQYQRSGISTWQTFTTTSSADGAAWVWPVQDGVLYNVRVRFVNTAGVQSPWVSGSHTIIGKTDPPPVFDVFTIMAQPDGTRQYNFGYTTTRSPVDWQGAEIRYISGTVATPDWASMSLLQDGRTFYTASPVELNAPLSGAYTFACKSIDTTGNESPYLVRSLTLPDRRLGSVFDEFYEKYEGWLGSLANCHIQDGYLTANDSTTWATLPATWAGWTRWNVAPASPITYITPVRDFGTIVTGQVNTTVDADGTALVEMATSANGTTWSAWGSAAAAFSTRWLKLRLTVTATGPFPVPVVRNFQYLINAPIRSKYINDVVLSALTGSYRIGTGDVRIPLAGTYSFLKRTSIVIQDSSAGTWTYARIDQALTYGPRWQFRLNGVLADPAFVDFFVEGF
jgi:hypothetical protein